MIWAIVVTVILIFIFHQCFWRRRNLPPGPIPWPLIGNIPAINMDDIDNQILEWKKVYGNVITLWLPKPTIIVGGNEELKDSFIKQTEKTAGRPDFSFMREMVGDNYGLVFSPDSFWRSQRRFALHVLRDFGVGRPILENAIISQASDACTYFKSLNKKPQDLTKVLSTCVGNIIYQLVFGTTISLESDYIFNFRNTTIYISKIFNHPFSFLMDLWEPIKYFKFLAGPTYKKSMKLYRQEVENFKRQIEEHRSTIDFESEPRDYIDAFLIEQRKQNPTMKSEGEWSDKQLIQSCLDLFSAGMETTSTTLRTLIFYMLHYPEIQEKIHEEIEGVIGKDKIITMSDQVKLPYFNACLQEAQRITTVLPLNLFHRVTDDVVVDGFRIPKGTTIIPQFENIHKDPEEFKDPEIFDPSRFLDSNMNFKKDERVTPFSLGKRACLGEALARMELFLFAATFFQHFQFLPENSKILPPFEYDISLGKQLKPFNVCIVERK